MSVKNNNCRGVPVDFHRSSLSLRMASKTLSMETRLFFGKRVTGSTSSTSKTSTCSGTIRLPWISPSSNRQSTWSLIFNPAARNTSPGKVTCRFSRTTVALIVRISHQTHPLSNRTDSFPNPEEGCAKCINHKHTPAIGRVAGKSEPYGVLGVTSTGLAKSSFNCVGNMRTLPSWSQK